MINSDQIKDFRERIKKLYFYLSIEEKKLRIYENELKSQDPTFWDDPKKAEILLKQNRELKFWVEEVESLQQKIEDLEVLIEFFNEGAGSLVEIEELAQTFVSDLESLELKNMLSEEEDRLSA